MNAGKYIAPVLALAMLSGCAATNPIAKTFRDQAKPLTAAQVVTSPQKVQGSMVVWGGRVVEVVNNGTNGVLIYLIKLQLAKNGKPMIFGTEDGPFIALDREYVDPAAFHYGRLITVAGQISGVRSEMAENTSDNSPVLAVRQAYAWPVIQGEYDSVSDDYFNADYGTPGWFVGPDWWWDGGLFYPRYYKGFNGHP